MRAIQSILLYKKNGIEIFSTKEFLRKLFYCIWPLLLVLIGFSVIRGHNKQKTVEREISALNKEYDLARNQYFELKNEYNAVSAVFIEQEKIRRVISAVNPWLRKEELNLWGKMLLENAKKIEYCLNDNTLKKLESKDHQYSFDPGMSLLLAVAALESDFNLYTKSRKGAFGPMQLREGTARFLGVQNLRDPADNISGGTKYLCDLLEKYHLFPDQLELTLASYNAGRTRVLKTWIPNWGRTWNDINDGLINSGRSFKETRNYVGSITTMVRLFVSGQWSYQNKRFWRNYKTITRETNVAVNYGIPSYGRFLP